MLTGRAEDNTLGGAVRHLPYVWLLTGILGGLVVGSGTVELPGCLGYQHVLWWCWHSSYSEADMEN